MNFNKHSCKEVHLVNQLAFTEHSNSVSVYWVYKYMLAIKHDPYILF